jgi:hypothetical protein
MLNRRDLFKALGAAFVGTTLPVQASKPEPIPLPSGTFSCFRSKRYKQYEDLYTKDVSQNYTKTFKDIADDLYRMFHFDKSEFSRMTFTRNRLYLLTFNAAVYGDVFCEVVSTGGYPINWQFLSPYSVFRIQTLKGKLLEFQQSMDYAALARFEIDNPCVLTDLKATSVRFHPDSMVHVRPNVGKYIMYGTSALDTGKLIIDTQFVNDLGKGIRELAEKFRL